jgi:hypothetical protein
MILKKTKLSNKMIKTIKCILGSFIITISLSCVKVDIVDKPKTKVNIQLPLDIEVSNSYTVEINGEKVQIGPDGNLPELFSGVYPILVYNNTPSISVANGIASINMINGKLNSFPDLFFSNSSEIRLEANSSNNTPIQLQQQVRLLEMRILPTTGGIYNHISSIEGKLTGVAGRWDIKNNTAIGPEMEIPVKFIKEENGTWLAKLRLLGVFGNKQELFAEINFSERTSKLKSMASSLQINQAGILSIQSDLTSYFRDFNIGKSTPFSLNGGIDLPTESDFVVSINDWELINETGIAL